MQPVGYRVPEGSTPQTLFDSALSLTSSLDLHDALQQFVEIARQLTGAKFSALGILGTRGETVAFHHAGMPKGAERALSHPPRGSGIFAHIPTREPLIINDVESHESFSGWPPGHPRMGNFLGVSLRVHEQVFGRLYLTDKEGGFTAEDGEAMEMLAAACSIAVQNARLYAESKNRANWIGVSQAITTALLEGSDEEEALKLIAARMRAVSDSCAALIILPSIGNAWVCEIADGKDAHDLIGIEFPPDGRAQTVIREGSGVVVDSMTRTRTLRIEALREYGPALYAPMMVHGTGVGVIVLLREEDGPEFDLADLAMAESVAKQAALALELAAARHAQDVAAQTDERAAIGRDLHDLAIQQLFATGMKITAIREDLEAKEADPAIVDLLNEAISSVDSSVTEIRRIVHRLREPDANVVVVERLRREASLARNGLGFAPSLIIELDGQILPSNVDPETIAHIDDIIGADIGDDVVAVTREGLSNAARHASASSVSVTCQIDRSRVRIEVADDGDGPSPTRSRRSGLANLAARARRHGGTFNLARGTESGAVMTWEVPL